MGFVVKGVGEGGVPVALHTIYKTAVVKRFEARGLFVVTTEVVNCWVKQEQSRLACGLDQVAFDVRVGLVASLFTAVTAATRTVIVREKSVGPMVLYLGIV